MSNLLGSHATQEDSTQNFHKFPNPTPSSTFVNTGSGTMSNVATSLVDQALQNKPGRGMLFGRNHFDGQGSAPMGGPSFNNSEPHGGDRYIDRSGGRDDYPSAQGFAPMGGPSFNNSEPHGGDRYIDRSGGRDDDTLHFRRDDYPS